MHRTYKVKKMNKVGDLWVIEYYRYCDYVATFNIHFYDEQTANAVCELLNEEVEEAYGDGQLSTI